MIRWCYGTMVRLTLGSDVDNIVPTYHLSLNIYSIQIGRWYVCMLQKTLLKRNIMTHEGHFN